VEDEEEYERGEGSSLVVTEEHYYNALLPLNNHAFNI
jgi:hypothetical protein